MVLVTFLMMLIAIAIIMLASFPVNKWYCNFCRFVVFLCAGAYMGESVVRISVFLEQYFK
ncbi:hypothetical protein [Escherichia phage pEC-M2929-1AR.1]|nr:hypothetical protein [Escherichia phage pEC-M2929-1AR.1]